MPTTRRTHDLTSIREEPERDPRKDLLDDLGLPDPPPTLEAFEAIEGATDALRAVKALATGDASPMLLIYGSTGCGKTHLLQGLVVAYYRRRVFCRYNVWSRVVRALRKGQMDGASPHYYELLERFCRTTAPLVIDDVGMGTTGTVREWADLEEIVNARYNDHLITVLGTNLWLTELPDRVVSRFFEAGVGLIILNSAKDYRRESHGKE